MQNKYENRMIYMNINNNEWCSHTQLVYVRLFKFEKLKVIGLQLYWNLNNMRTDLHVFLIGNKYDYLEYIFI